MDPRSRVIGSVVGLALGDALGAPFEGRRASEIPSPLPAFELPRKGFPPGSGTDATAMARILARSLVSRRGLDVDDVLERHVEWLASSPPEVGSLTRVVLSWARDGMAEPARRYVEERGPEVSAGNGSVMYCAPLGAVYARAPEQLAELAPALSALTHWDARCATACLAVTLAVAGLVRGDDAQRAVIAAVRACEGREGDEELEALVDGAGIARPIDGPDRGFVFFTAGVALRTAAHATTVEQGLRDVVALGGDTGTNAAVAGALLGARDGSGALPRAWLASLADRDAIEREAEALADLAVESSRPRPRRGAGSR
jgi:ADP-ribosyl-[dinitrogen reductase] hydrolase